LNPQTSDLATIPHEFCIPSFMLCLEWVWRDLRCAHHAVLRKIGHFVGYFILSVLLFRSWRATFPRLSTRWCRQWATVALLSTALVAILDEWHQSFLLSRSGALRDVILDSTAGLVAQAALFTIANMRSITSSA
jgi:VanZ family protein